MHQIRNHCEPQLNIPTGSWLLQPSGRGGRNLQGQEEQQSLLTLDRTACSFPARGGPGSGELVLGLGRTLRRL